jgi:hypothetical protein
MKHVQDSRLLFFFIIMFWYYAVVYLDRDILYYSKLYVP